MPFKLSIFSKIIVALCCLLVPIVLLYSYSHQVSTGLVEREINKSNGSRLAFFISQVDSTADQLWKSAFNLSEDPDATKLTMQSILTPSYNIMETKRLITAKADNQSSSFGWENELTLYAPSTGQFITTNPAWTYDEQLLRLQGTDSWTYRKIRTDRGEGYYFVRYLSQPYMARLVVDNASLIVEVAFASHNITDMLDQLKQGSSGDPFFYHPEYESVTNKSYDRELFPQIVSKLKERTLDRSGNLELELNGRTYILTYERSDALGWYLIDYIPLEELLMPITNTRRLFYLSTGLLLLASLLAAALLYRNVQVPVRELIRSIQKLKRGDYSSRVSKKTNNEFQFLFDQFNHMSEEIQQLIENILSEKLRVRDATLKQLQAQINPHFLYNSFAFIQSLAQLEDKESIIEVTQHLSKYYRYTTRMEKLTGTLKEELDLIRHFLEIHKMKMHRLQYAISIRDEMSGIALPRLLLQPLVENAILHGIDPKPGKGMIRITGRMEQGAAEITVEDNGPGLDVEQLARLEAKFKHPMDGEMGCGLWNVRQRLVHGFGADSELMLGPSPLGGLQVTLRIYEPAVLADGRS
ncbi:sensor histidine kinase [Gorillibacterium sp. sgz5001074]|uniref:sensor histidine kinase n=1 Tax=Gorillibacterium sp. sgz5001074 TaxID=3446695 RepID=UPI003F6715DB